MLIRDTRDSRITCKPIEQNPRTTRLQPFPNNHDSYLTGWFLLCLSFRR